VDFRVAGILFRHPTGLSDRQAAEEKAADIVRRVERKAGGSTKASELIQEFARRMRRERRSEKQVLQNTRCLDPLIGSTSCSSSKTGRLARLRRTLPRRERSQEYASTNCRAQSTSADQPGTDVHFRVVG
jgi:hypothetical protein